MLNKKNIATGDTRKYSLDAPFEIIEAYNSLVSNLLCICNDKGYKSIGVTSAGYNENKTSVAVDLASSLADNLINKRILLVDSDLRRSDVSAIMCPEATIGLSNFISENSAEPAIINTEIKNLDILPAGNAKANPTGLLRSDKMGSILKSLEEKYDYIIIDTAPVNEYADALFLADRVSGFIVSTKKKVSSISKIDQAATRIESSGAEIIGFVFSE